MPLVPQAVELPFVRGVDTKRDPRLVEGPALLVLQDGELDGQGIVRKRPGSSVLSSTILGGASMPTGKKLAQRADQLLTLAGTNYPSLYSYSDSYAASVLVGTAGLAGLEKQSIVRDDADETYFDMAVSGSMLLVAWKSASTTLSVRFVDLVTGVVLNETALSIAATVASTPRIFSGGIVYLSAGNLEFRPLNSSTLTYGAAVTVRNNANLTPQMEAIALSTGRILVAYRNATPQLELVIISQVSGATITGPAVRAADPSGAIGLGEFANGVIQVCYGNGGVNSFTYSAALAAPTGTISLTATTVINKIGICTSPYNTANLLVAWTAGAGGTYARVFTGSTEVSNGGAFVANRTDYWGQALAGRPFYTNTEAYLPLSQPSTEQSMFLIQGAQLGLVAYSMPGTGGGEVDGNFCNVVSTTIDGRAQVLVLAREQGRFEVRAGKALTRKGLALMKFDPLRIWNSVQLGGCTYFAGSRPLKFDGKTLTQMGFTTYPEGLTGLDAGAAGNLSAGTYSWVAVLEYVDNQGVVHRSSPSTPVSLTLAASHQADITVPRPVDIPTTLTNANTIRVYLYRTRANGTIYYNVPGANAGTAFTGTNATTIRDNVADTTIAANEVLYTTGGALEKMPLPPCRHLCLWQNRLFAVSTDADEIAYTQQFNQGDTIAPMSHETLRLYPPPGGGKLIATAVLDDKLIIFRERKTLVTQGQGPNALGLDSSYTTPQALPGDVGCSTAASVIETPVGVMFQSAKGIYLLDRSLQLQYVGAPVEAYNSQYVIKAVVHAVKNQVRFAIGPTASAATNLLVYNYEFDQWGVFTGSDSVDMVSWGSSFIFLNGTSLYQEGSGIYQDGSTDYGVVVETAWIKTGGLAGFQRLKWLTVLGEVKGSIDLKLEIFNDYSSTAVETVRFTTSDSNDYDRPMLFRHRVQYQKCTAFKVRITEDVARLGITGSIGAWLSALRLEVAVKRGSGKLPATRTV